MSIQNSGRIVKSPRFFEDRNSEFLSGATKRLFVIFFNAVTATFDADYTCLTIPKSSFPQKPRKQSSMSVKYDLICCLFVSHLMRTLMSFANLLLGHWQRVRWPVTVDVTTVHVLEHKNKIILG